VKQEGQKIRRVGGAALAAAGVALLGVTAGCGKSTAPSSPGSGGSASGAPVAAVASVAAGGDGGLPAMEGREAAQWAMAKEGEAEELARLADLEGCEGLRERADDAELRMTAIRAMQYCRDFSELPWLAQIAAGPSDDEAKAALESVVELAARPRRATDPEDADELHTGCGALLELARAQERPRARRVLAIRALRMLADRGCAKKADIPTELDAR